jgi:uncharacterized protein involved in response to NO
MGIVGRVDQGQAMILAWRHLSAAPHRLFFLAGAVSAILSMVAWGVLLLGRVHGDVPELPLPAGAIHGAMLLFGCLPFFVMGFTLTATPQWLGDPPPPRGDYVPGFGLMLAGVALLLGGVFISPAVLASGMALHCLGWAWVTWSATGLIRRSRHPGKRHFYMAIAVIVAGLLAELLLLVAVVSGEAHWAATARSAALWLFLVPTFFSISHRVIPVFTRLAGHPTPLYQPLWMLPVMTVCCLTHFGLDLGDQGQLLWLTELPLLVMALLLLWRWDSLRYLCDPEVGFQHLAFTWLPVALSLMMLDRYAGWSLGWAPLHALLLGYFGTMVLGTSARIIRVQAGLAPRPDDLMRVALWCYVPVPLLRILADTPLMGAQLAYWGYALAGGLWIICWAVWLRRLGPLLFTSAALGSGKT